MLRAFLFSLLLLPSLLSATVKVGIERLCEEKEYQSLLRGKNIGLITNHTAIDSHFTRSFHLIKNQGVKIVALFTPEHGLFGDAHAGAEVADSRVEGIPVYSLHGKTRRPTTAMLRGVDLLLFDIQDIGARSYTYITTLFYCMEEAALRKIPIIVTDRPNPMGGLLVDGSPLEEKWRSFVGYINTPYCHGMTVGELAQFFNEEYKIGANLAVIPMKGWKREDHFAKTGLPWVPTSPNIPEPDTPLYYATTGILGELSLVNIGIGSALPFKIVGAPWIDAEKFAAHLSRQKLPAVSFYPYHFTPFYGKYKGEKCHGIKIYVNDPSTYLPVTTQYTILGVLKTLHEEEVKKSLHKLSQNTGQREFFHKINGSEKTFHLIAKEKFFIWKLREEFQLTRTAFLEKRKKYLITDY